MAKTISTELQRIIDAKADIKQAIEGKGVEVSSELYLSDYAGKIEQITAGGAGGGGQSESGSGNIKIRFFDFDGILLWTHYANLGESLNEYPLPNPSHPEYNLVFEHWNWSLSDLENIDGDVDVGAVYKTNDDKTHIYLILTATHGLSVDMYFSKSNSDDTLTIDWGDGNIDSDSSSSGATQYSHTYDDYGEYIVKVGITSGAGTYSFANHSVNAPFMPTKPIIPFIFTGLKCGIGGMVFRNLTNLKCVTLNSGITRFFNQTFDNTGLNTILIFPKGFGYNDANYTINCKYLKHISIAKNTRNSGTRGLAGAMNALNRYITPPNFTQFTIGVQAYNLQSVFLRSNITSVTINTTDAYSLKEIVCMATTPPTLSHTDWINYADGGLTIYVPDSSVASYKSATNWNVLADRIKGISLRI